jgi:betaine-aldehyde dehydrogenase
VPTGSKVMQAAAADIKAISLELGGKSPFVVFADSDIDKAVEWIMFGIFWNQGQVCSATSRILVERPLYAPLLERLAAEAAKITIGGGMEEGVLLGPIVSQGQYAKVLGAIERGKAEGADWSPAASAPPGATTGYFVEPTVFADVPLSSWIWREEIFGPVVCVNPFDTEEEAVRLANDSPYGLAGAVMSDDLERCERVAAALRAGIVWINCSQPTFTEAPWGGYKRSGIGRELGRWGFDAFRQVKQVTAFDASQKWGWYLK